MTGILAAKQNDPRAAAAYAAVLACDLAGRAGLTVSDLVRLIRAAWKLRSQ